LAAPVGHGVSLRLAVDGDLGTVEIDPTAFEQVILSLALNANRMMGGKGELLIEASPRRIAAANYAADRVLLAPGDYSEVAIVDDGPGISAEHINEIFDPHLVDLERIGTGLGLAMCWGVIEQAGGTIQVESQPGEGSTFRVLLPRLERSVAVAAVGEVHVPAVRATRHAKVLVVDDEAAIRQVVVRQLEAAGHSAVEAVDGADALSQLSRDPSFDLVVCDVLMPVMGGMELARRLEERHCPVPVLLISGYAPSDAPSVPSRRWPLLSKPFTADMLLDAVGKLLATSEAPPVGQ
jgi:CheY-like chemotaxis protein